MITYAQRLNSIPYRARMVHCIDGLLLRRCHGFGYVVRFGWGRRLCSWDWFDFAQDAGKRPAGWPKHLTAATATKLLQTKERGHHE